MFRSSGPVAIISFFLLFALAFPVTAQEISEAELEKAAKAYVEIAMISQQFQESVQQTSDPDERQQMQQEANSKMITAVEEADLSVESYNEIMGKISKDEALAEKFTSKLQDVNK
jgi:3-hydroxyacyl-CoA dehydrogenase